MFRKYQLVTKIMKLIYKLHIDNFFTFILNFILPDRTKRLILLSSLASALNHCDSLDKQTIRKLNALLSLAYNDEAMYFPISISDMIWHNVDLISLETQSANLNVDESIISLTKTEYILNHIPTWLKYGTYENIKKDVLQILNTNSITVEMVVN